MASVLSIHLLLESGDHTQVVGFEWQELWLLPIPLTLNIHAQQKVEFSILKVRW